MIRKNYSFDYIFLLQKKKIASTTPLPKWVKEVCQSEELPIGVSEFLQGKTKKEDFFIEANRVEGITEEDYLRAKPYIETAQAFAQTTYQSIYIIEFS